MNRLLKTIIAGVSALTMCISVMPLSASAATIYKKGDVNCDDSVKSNDLLFIKNFLNGVYRTNNGTITERLDVDQNGIIDINDQNYINDYMLGNVNDSTITSENTTTLPAVEKRSYYVYDAQTGTHKTTEDYTIDSTSLTNIPTSSSNSISTCSIIGGKDERYYESGYNGVVKIGSASSGTFSQIGTAFVVDAHTILTAAHCVYGKTKLQFQFYSNATTVSKTVNGVKCHIPAQYIANATVNNANHMKYDYALVTVADDLSQYVNFNLGVMRNNATSKGHTLYNTGFGKISASDTSDSRYNGVNTNLINGDKYTGYGSFYSTLTSTDYNFKFTTDVLPGNSGGPVYVVNGNIKTAVGICTQQYPSYNSGVRITTDILNFVYNNKNLTY